MKLPTNYSCTLNFKEHSACTNPANIQGCRTPNRRPVRKKRRLLVMQVRRQRFGHPNIVLRVSFIIALSFALKNWNIAQNYDGNIGIYSHSWRSVDLDKNQVQDQLPVCHLLVISNSKLLCVEMQMSACDTARYIKINVAKNK